MELDSHADSPVVGRGAYILSYTNKKVSVAEFTSELGKPLTVPVVNAASTAAPKQAKYTPWSFVMHFASGI